MGTRILYDAFHHMPPGHRVGPHIAVGGYRTNYGRYTIGDVYHPNGLAHLEAMLASEYQFRLLTQPYSAASLYDTDILLAMNPDYPLYEGATPYRWEPEDVDALMAFMRRGGSVILAVNSFLSRPDFWEENFDLERVSLLFDRLGIRWDPNYMSDDKTIERAKAGRFTIGYGQGGRVVGNKLPKGFKPLITFKGMTYGFIGRIGRGTLAVVGDAGMMSNGLICFPGFDNAAFVADLFDKLRPSWTRRGAKAWNLNRYAHLSAPPRPQGLTEPVIRGLRPNGTWMVDHHYRHLTWDQEERASVGAVVWKSLPMDAVLLRSNGKSKAKLDWLRLDSDDPGSAFEIDLNVRASRSDLGTDVRVNGRASAQALPAKDLARRPDVLKVLAKVNTVHAVFELDAVLDKAGNPQRARWRQGQILFAPDKASQGYGYQIALSSTNGAIMPATR